MATKVHEEYFELFKNHPIEEGEKKRDYYIRIGELIGKSDKTIKERYLQLKNKISEYCETAGVPNKSVKHGWVKTKDTSLFFTNPDYEGAVNYDTIREKLIDDLKAYAPKYPKIKRNEIKDGHLLVIDPADIHIGKLCMAFETGEDYNENIAVKRVLEGVQGIIDKSQGYNIDKILFIGGNDILHIDSPKRQTTAGTPQDTDGMWYSNFLKAKQVYIDCLEMLLPLADVHFTFNPSNHDYQSGFFLADVIQSWFRLNKNITFDCSIAHRKGFKYGLNLIGTTHGDGAKMNDLPLLMACEFPKWWAETKHRYVFTHHVHHKTSKDQNGICVESLRSPSGTDSWHHKKGYGVGGIKAIEGFLHHKENGQIARFTHIF